MTLNKEGHHFANVCRKRQKSDSSWLGAKLKTGVQQNNWTHRGRRLRRSQFCIGGR